MDGSSEPVLWYRRFNPQGKVRKRVQDLRIPSSSYWDFIATRPRPDLSHNESARLAADALLSRGLEGYHEVLNAEGEVDFLSELDKIYILENGMDGSTGCKGVLVHLLSSLRQILLFIRLKKQTNKSKEPIAVHSFMQGFISAGDPGAADGQLESSSVDSQSATGSPSASTNSDATAAAGDLSRLKGIL